MAKGCRDLGWRVAATQDEHLEPQRAVGVLGLAGEGEVGVIGQVIATSATNAPATKKTKDRTADTIATLIQIFPVRISLDSSKACGIPKAAYLALKDRVMETNI